jgi:hypothetical protein
VKLPKHILAALGRPRVTCPKCRASAEITAKGTIDKHRAYRDPFRGQCGASGTTAPEGAAVAWIARQIDAERAYAAEARETSRNLLERAENREATAAELEKVIARESGKGTSL